jgi:cellulose synthase/poly-beta-1,6-N-acetylglucosamine synthase-like glycosyltransferase
MDLMLRWATGACLLYLAVVYGSYLLLIAVGLSEAWTRRQERQAEDFDTIAHSRFTIPVSILVPAFNEEAGICDTVRSLLSLDYPELEIIVVSDGSTDATVERLLADFPLRRARILARRILLTSPVHAVYRCEGKSRLLLIDKANGGKADTLNVGINYARFRYVCCVDADTVLARDALLKAMRLVIADPGRIVGLTSYLTVARDPAAAVSYPAHERELERQPLIAFQHLDFLRSFFNNRLAWSRLDFMLCASGAFQVWRRDVLEQLDGYSTNFTCEDIELTFRVHEHFRRNRIPYKILCMPEEAGVTEGPDSIRKLISQRERWQRVTLETLWRYRHMFLNPRYGTVGLIGVPYYVLSEALSPVFETLAVITFITALALGVLTIHAFAMFIVMMMFATALLTTFAILSHDTNARTYRSRDLVWLITLAICDLILYRPVNVWAKAKGTSRFLHHDRSWDRFERNNRTQLIHHPAIHPQAVRSVRTP